MWLPIWLTAWPSVCPPPHQAGERFRRCAQPLYQLLLATLVSTSDLASPAAARGASEAVSLTARSAADGSASAAVPPHLRYSLALEQMLFGGVARQLARTVPVLLSPPGALLPTAVAEAVAGAGADGDAGSAESAKGSAVAQPEPKPAMTDEAMARALQACSCAASCRTARSCDGIWDVG